MVARGAATSATPGIFARRATGLVREMGGADGVITNLIFINLVLGVLLYTLAPFIFPGVNMALGYVLTTLVLIGTTLVYSLLAAAMPRSGGEYVYISRILHPLPGLVFNFGYTVAAFMFIAILSAFVAPLGIGAMFETLGTVQGNDTLLRWGAAVTSDNWTFAIGFATIIVTASLNYFGLRRLIRAQRYMLGIALLGLAIAAVLMATTSREEFERRFASFGDFDAVIRAAENTGFAVGAGNSIGKTLAFLALGFTVLALTTLTAYTAGEMRNPRRNSIVSMVGGLISAGIIFTVLAALAQRTFGNDFLGGMTHLFSEGSEAYPDIPPPFFLLYASMLTDSSVLITLMTIGIIFALVANIAQIILLVTRNLLAWSLDNILPAAVRETHPKYHSPSKGIGVVAVLGTAVLAAHVYGPPDAFNFVFSAAALQAFVFTAAAVAAIVFPWRARAVFESSPYSHRVLGVPVITLVGLWGFGWYLYFALKLVTDDRIGANATSGLVAIGIGLGAGGILYGVAWIYNRLRGVDIRLAYAELPPE